MQNQNNNQIGISSPASYQGANPSLDYTDVIKQLEDALRCDAQRVQLLMQQGTISTSQGQYLMTQLARKFNEINMCKNSVPMQNATAQNLPPQTSENPMEMFMQEHPDFFKKGARGTVLDYIKDLNMNKDEISKIAQIVEGLETSAIEGYLKQSAHEKSLNDENAIAKSKLTSYAQNASKDATTGRIFTREDIGRMTVDEFAKNEKLIMDQVKQGLIK